MSNPIFELNKILKLEAEELISAREKAIAIHHTSDIDAAGDEVEQAVRNTIRKKLPLDYYVGHGHVVDEKLNYSGQYDIVIADNSGSPILFKTQNGTEYFPFESLYAVGEIKSTYYNSRNYVQDFIKKTKELHTKLSRIQTGPNQITKDLAFTSSGSSLTLTSSDKRPCKNPIFKFMFIIDKGDFKPEQFAAIYKNEDDKYLPNVVCILNSGIIIKCNIKSESGQTKLGAHELFPEFIDTEKKEEYKWTFVELGKEVGQPAANLAFMFFALNQHLRTCLVLKPNLLQYFSNLFKVNSAQMFN